MAIMPFAGMRIAAYMPFVNELLDKYAIHTPARQAAFFARVAHETGELAKLEENLNYSIEALVRVWPNRFKSYDGSPNAKAVEIAKNPQAIANFVYANRMGNGDEASGDGWRYRGRGWMHITGKDGYAKAGKKMGINLVSDPDMLLYPQYAMESACIFWSDNKLNKYADSKDIDGVCDVINIGRKTEKVGDANGYKDTLTYYNRAKQVLGVN